MLSVILSIGYFHNHSHFIPIIKGGGIMLVISSSNSMGSIFGLIMILFVIALGIAVYFIPTIIAFRKGRDNRISILALNFFLGWSLIGWVISLVWALKEV